MCWFGNFLTHLQKKKNTKTKDKVHPAVFISVQEKVRSGYTKTVKKKR